MGQICKLLRRVIHFLPPLCLFALCTMRARLRLCQSAAIPNHLHARGATPFARRIRFVQQCE